MSQEPASSTLLPIAGIGVDVANAHACLVNVAETLQHVLLPTLEGHGRKNAEDCIEIVLHLAAALRAPEADREALAAIAAAGSLREQALAEGRAIEHAYARARADTARVRAAQAPLSRSCDPARIEAYLRAQPQGGDAVRVRSAVPLPGGRSKQTILVTIEHARELPDELVIRQDWAAAVTGTSVAMEFEVLRRVHQAGIRVPRPLLIETGSDALGAPFIVVARVAGRNVGDVFDPPGVEAVRELAGQIGRIHALPTADFTGLPGIAERSHTTVQLREDLARFRAVIDQLGSPVPAIVRFAFEWLERNVDRVHSPRTLVHGDCGWHNNLVDNGHLSAILDWEMVHIGSATLDLGWMKVASEKALPWSEFLAIYRSAGGPEVDQFSIDWYNLYTRIWLLHLLLQARAAVTAGVLHDIDYTLICARYAPSLMAVLSHTLNQALAPER